MQKPPEAGFLAGRAECYLKLNQPELALKDADEAVKRSPGGSWPCLFARARSRARLGKLDKAILDYGEGLTMHKEGAISLERAQVYERMGNKIRADADRRTGRH